ncbi:MAG: glycoside hydrolase family 130 protein [Candidatus Eremiobacteraeota bacterium]|nr:glycoside hydrolase family 130 protein [Candidatus Eremiobacteraeota bacterium]
MIDKIGQASDTSKWGVTPQKKKQEAKNIITDKVSTGKRKLGVQTEKRLRDLALQKKAGQKLVPGIEDQPAENNWSIGPFRKFEKPIMEPTKEGFDSKNVYNMATIREGDTYYMIYRGEDKNETADDCTGRLGLAVSKDGINFEREPNPIILPDQPYDKQGIEDPRLVKIDDTYVLTYTAYDGKTAKLCLATSKDMRNWEKKGPLFPEFPADVDRTADWTKSGAILPERMKEGPFKDKYIMYFGDTDMWMGYSDDLENWSYVKEPVLRPREGKFDSRIVEPGPPPIKTKDGILLIYNGSTKGKPGENFGGYYAGAVLFDPKDPTKVLKRSEKPLIGPTQDWEKEGYVDNVSFVEGLTVSDDGTWNMYFGGADRSIGLAVADFKPELLSEQAATAAMSMTPGAVAVGIPGSGVYKPTPK